MNDGAHRHYRTDYSKAILTEDEAGHDPIALFARWLRNAEDDGAAEPHAMALATTDDDGVHCRIVLLRGFDERGFVFFTNHNSRKAMDLEREPRAALTFFWREHERQVRIEGTAERVDAAEADAYFATRPRESRIGAWSSDQSHRVEGRAEMEERFERWMERFADGDVPRPSHWGGYRVRPARIEFWQGRPNRLHDRILYERAPDGGWHRTRLQP